MVKNTFNYNKLTEKCQKITQLNNLLAIIQWDMAVNMPSGAANSRDQEVASLATLIHELSTSQEMEACINAAKDDVATLDDWGKANFYLIEKQYKKQKCISAQLKHAYSLAISQCEFTWRSARKKNDYAQLVPLLDQVFELLRTMSKLEAAYFQQDAYDVLLDTYDPGRKTSEIQAVYKVLKEALPELIATVCDQQASEKITPLPAPIPVAIQREIGLYIIEKMGFDLQKGRLDASTHPFCMGAPTDVRLTTRYNEACFTTGIFGIIHEAGHGLYQQNLPQEYMYQPVGQDSGMSFHESQSLIMENQVGTSWPFIQFLAKVLRDQFGFKGPAYTAENLYKLVTRVKPSFIRVEADEITYPMHVILRFEIEQAIINDQLNAADIPAVWNEKMKAYLGIIPPNNQLGCMQDIHWPSGKLGYFPSYTNGAIIASMLMKAAQKVHHMIENDFVEGDLSRLNQYLNTHLRQWGSLKQGEALLAYSTGENNIDPNIYLDYLRNKYLRKC